MMPRTASFMLLAIVLIASLASCSASRALFAWSQSAPSSQASSISKWSALHEGAIDDISAAFQPAKLVLVYLSSSNVSPSMSRLLNTFVPAPLSIPYLDGTWNVKSSIGHYLSQHASASVFGLGENTFGYPSLSLQELQTVDEAVVVVSVDSMEQVQQMEESVKAPHVAILSSVTPDDLRMKFDGKADRRVVSKRGVDAVEDDTTEYDSEWPPQVIEGLLLSAVLVFTAVVGFWVTMNIQTPERFEGGEKRRA